jgi:hypothetical protein
MRSGSHLGEFAPGTYVGLDTGGLQNVIQTNSPNPYLHEDLAGTATIVRACEGR